MERKISNVEKGDDFENRALGIIKKLIEDSQISHLPEQIRIYTKKDKGYYSNMREANIFFDLSIEVWPPNAERSVFNYFIECKNYGSPVPVGEITKFAGYVKQVAGLNCKAIFIANTRLTKEAYNTAKNLGMMLIQGESEDDFSITLHKPSQTNVKAPIPILKTTQASSFISEGTTHIERLIDDTIKSVFSQLKIRDNVSYGIDRLTKKHIKNLANIEINKFYPDISETINGIDLGKLKSHIENTYNIEIKEFSSPNDLLGKCDWT